LSYQIKEKSNLQLLDIEETEIIRPYYSTDELSRYFGKPKNSNWIIYTRSDIKTNIKKYPNIQKHLDNFKNVITSDNKPYGLHRARVEDFFVGEKIISLRKCLQPTFTYTDFNCYVSQTFFVIKTARYDIKYLTGLLNSKLIAFWLRHNGKMQGSHYQIDKAPLMNIPIMIPSEDLEKKIKSQVEIILDQKEIPSANETSKLECQIDQLVYQLYELTEEEIAIVEESMGR